MKKWHDELPFAAGNELTDEIFQEDTLFFDIETTGFSAAHTKLYLIGCAARQGDKLIIEQFFAECQEEEQNLLLTFLTKIRQYKTVITFNGQTFDLPYLKAKCNALKIPEFFPELISLDLYQTVKQLKFLLHLNRYNLKSIEQFLGICRKDLYDGKELTDIYEEYLLHPSEKTLLVLKQHNYEDVLHLPALLPVISYAKILDGGYSVTAVEGHEYKNAEGIICKELFFSLKNKYPVPKCVSVNNGLFFLWMKEDYTTIRIPLYEGELKYFFEDYKNYYFLPEEDMAIHKSVGSFLERSKRIQATASNCYTRKYGLFVPQQKELIKPLFCSSKKDKITYFELTDSFTESEDLTRSYIDHILASLKSETKLLQ